jgi:hypothetical protein
MIKKDVKVMKNIHCRPRRPPRFPAKRCATEGLVGNEAELQMVDDQGENSRNEPKLEGDRMGKMGEVIILIQYGCPFLPAGG